MKPATPEAVRLSGSTAARLHVTKRYRGRVDSEGYACNRCNADVAHDDAFCRSCGRKFVETLEQPVTIT